MTSGQVLVFSHAQGACARANYRWPWGAEMQAFAVCRLGSGACSFMYLLDDPETRQASTLQVLL